ncbi:hypothetical protein FOCC_FOCC003931, partial [Frankliniella occidentalis]
MVAGHHGAVRGRRRPQPHGGRDGGGGVLHQLRGPQGVGTPRRHRPAHRRSSHLRWHRGVPDGLGQPGGSGELWARSAGLPV